MKPDTRSFYQAMVQGAIERIAGHLDEAIDLEALAGRAGLSPYHFHRIFRGMTGETPLELARRLRLERAAWRLSRSDAPVTDIAFGAGYETHEAFTRAFRACFSTSPSGFREKAYRRITLAATCGVHFNPDGDTPVRAARFRRTVDASRNHRDAGAASGIGASHRSIQPDLEGLRAARTARRAGGPDHRA